MAKLANTNTTDIADAMALGCRTMQRLFNADDGDVPFFRSRVVPHRSSPTTGLSGGSWALEAHVPGRHLNALLSAEDAAGIPLDESAIDKHARAAFLSFSGPLPLPLNRPQPGYAPVNFLVHNLREGMHALYALVRYRNSKRARETAEGMIAAVLEYWHPERGWDIQRLERQGLNVSVDDPILRTFITNEARLLGPLVKYYRATGHGPALELALLFKEKAISEFFREDGDYDGEVFGHHTHSTTCTMSSLAQLADLTGDAALMGRIRAFYDNGMWKIRDEIGWVIEHSGPDRCPDRGEANTTGDVVETALILGRWGWPEYFHDAERIVRGHLLPSQVRDTSFIVEPPNPRNEDGKRNIAERHLGAFGFPAPYGFWPAGLESLDFNTDLVGGVVASLCEVLREATRFDRSGHWVNLLFDCETAAIRVESPYTHPRLSVTVKRPGPLFVRIPPWVERNRIALRGAEAVPCFANDYLLVSTSPVRRPVTIDFDLPVREQVLEHRTHDIRARLRGDQVMAMDNFGTDLTFFDPYS